MALVQIGAESGQVDTFRTELANLGAIFSANPEIEAAFVDPAISHEQKKCIMGELVALSSCSELVGNFLLLLVDKNRVAFLRQIVQMFETLADEYSGILRPTITTAFELDDAQLTSIRDALERRSARRVEPRVVVDGSLLGGVVVQINDVVFDSSVRTQLNRIQDQLQKG
jgi:F-type H+-transporting ATPase subunit delta